MKKIILPLIMLSLVISSLDSATRRYRATFRTDPSTTISIGWDQYSGNSPVLYYGTVDNGTNWNLYPLHTSPVLTTTDGGMNNTFVRLSGLSPGTIYYFVIKDSEGISLRYSFQTISNDQTQPLSLICGADTRSGVATRIVGYKLVAKLRPMAIIFDGDLTDAGSAAELQSWFDDYTNTIATDGRITPIVLAEGNHETGVVNISNLYDTPNDGTNYENNYNSLPFGGKLLRVYSLNSNLTDYTVETAWLKSQLMSYGNSTIWNLPQYHLPVRPTTSVKSNNDNEYRQWVPLFEQYNVKLVQEADAHVFSMTWPIKSSSATGNAQGFVRDNVNGIVYFGQGGWGAPLYVADNPKSWTRGYEAVNHFMLLHLYPDHVDIYTIRFENEPNVPVLMDQTRFTIPGQLSLETMTDENGIQSGNVATISRVINSLPDNTANSISVFPSFVQNNLTVRMDNSFGESTVKITDLTGKIIDNQPVNSSGVLQLNMTGYQAGVYIVDVINQQNLKVFKIIKQ